MTQPEALRLADFLDDQYDPSHNLEEAAAELRRLVAENALLHERHHFDNGVLKELLEVLRRIATVNAMDYEYQAWARAVEAKLKEKNA